MGLRDDAKVRLPLLNVTFPVISKAPTGLHYRYMYLGAAAYRADALPPPLAPVGWLAVIDINSIPPGLSHNPANP
jgi:hypothetical protein